MWLFWVDKASFGTLGWWFSSMEVLLWVAWGGGGGLRRATARGAPRPTDDDPGCWCQTRSSIRSRRSSLEDTSLAVEAGQKDSKLLAPRSNRTPPYAVLYCLEVPQALWYIGKSWGNSGSNVGYSWSGVHLRRLYLLGKEKRQLLLRFVENA